MLLEACTIQWLSRKCQAFGVPPTSDVTLIESVKGGEGLR
jgi:hypothetical protein